MLQNKTIIPFVIITFFTLSVFPFSSVFAQGKMFLQKKPDFNVDLQQPSKGVVLEKAPKPGNPYQCVRALNDFFLWYDDIAGMLETKYQDIHTLSKWDAAVTSINAGSIIIAEELHRLEDLDRRGLESGGNIVYFHINESYQKVQEAHQTLTLLEQDLRQAWWYPQYAVRPDNNLCRPDADQAEYQRCVARSNNLQNRRKLISTLSKVKSRMLRYCGVQGFHLPPSPGSDLEVRERAEANRRR